MANNLLLIGFAILYVATGIAIGVGLYYAGYNNASQSMSGCQPINAMFSNIYKTNFHLHKLKVSLNI